MTAVCVPSIRQHLRERAAQIRCDLEKRQHGCARSRDWFMLPVETRMAVLLLAGIDGDLNRLAARKFGEFADDEKIAVQVVIRSLYAGLHGAVSLRARAA